MAEQFVFVIHRLNKHYGHRQVLRDINLAFYPGAKIGVVGDNGSGKSTLLRIMAGLDQEFDGHAAPTGSSRVGMVAQEPQLDLDKTVRANLEQACADTVALLHEFDELTARMGELEGEAMNRAMERMQTLQDEIEARDGWNLDRAIDVACNALVLPPDDVPVARLSGGERRRVALARALLERPDMLLLDEPTNHLDAETITWLEQQLIAYPGTVVIATHDRYFLDNVTRWILELDGGRGIPFEGNYSSWLAQKIELLAQQEKTRSARRRSLESELKWIRMNAREHHALSHARLANYERLVATDGGADEDDSAIQIAPAEHLGDQVIEAHAISKGYADQPLFQDLSFVVPRGAVVGMIGPNGTGKTTLFRLITGQEQPDSGHIVVGPTVRMAYVDQHRDTLHADATVFDEICEGKNEIPFGRRAIPARSYVARFNFKGADQQKKVGNLSGGERNRVHLARLLKSGANVLLLDEPTNDLDVGTLRMLEDAILGFGGCVLVISHDRFFLNRICTHLLVFEGNAQVRWFEGNYEEYQAARAEETGDKALADRRARYRRLPRL